MNETQERLNILYELNLLSIDQQGKFDRLTQLVTRILDAPVSLVTTIAKDYQWFIGCTGLKEPYATERRTPMSHSFCEHVVSSKSPLIISDAREHPLVKDNLAIRDLDVIAYLGIPLVTSDDIALGSFCVIDHKPRVWSANDISLMAELASTVMTEIELRSELHKRQQAEHLLTEYIREREQLRLAKEMTASLSHDLRTPLSSITLKADMLAHKITDDNHLRWVQSMQEKLAEINTTLKNFSLLWLSNESAHIHSQKFDLLPVIHAASTYIADQAYYDASRMKIIIEASQANYPLVANDQLLKVAFANIIENALIFNESDPAQVTITIEQDVNLIHITITDNGIGISPDDLSYIFDPLFKVNKARTQSASASGIGLTVARQIIEEHLGKIKARSIEGGTQIIITLPLYLTQDDEINRLN
ncbi:MAG: GAF domain-containing sensor histidine kinase [Phototrophicaceae bacterium]